MKTSDFDYHLPPERIAQHPVEPRDAARLLVLEHHSGRRTHTTFRQLSEYLNPGDLLVANRSRVVPARLAARKLPGGGKAELLLLERVDAQRWKALAGGKGLGPGRQLELPGGIRATVEEDLGGAQRLVAFDRPLDEQLPKLGRVPLPPYIHAPLAEPERYQTVYAEEPGSAAAPTAGLHFTPALITALRAKGVGFASVLLHIGLDTFAPVTEEDPAQHRIHTEWCQLPAETAAQVEQTRATGGRVVAVGTTSVRTLETAARAAQGSPLAAFEGRSDLFIRPGYQFQVVDALLTNFHLPCSTLIMLVSALAGRENILASYREAIELEYRFYSFGDAMLII
ncbi:MAG: tRNA preQ1(34) S-adenosylmethionine ribosyltransferase-isomerase QueA [Anaerolineales bacterium]|nr:tRNA preQ1(34) S-adenosylmethionine ribosyltransferase-isomerase QueA [Anaerolineales bacterium]